MPARAQCVEHGREQEEHHGCAQSPGNLANPPAIRVPLMTTIAIKHPPTPTRYKARKLRRRRCLRRWRRIVFGQARARRLPGLASRDVGGPGELVRPCGWDAQTPPVAVALVPLFGSDQPFCGRPSRQGRSGSGVRKGLYFSSSRSIAAPRMTPGGAGRPTRSL